MFYLPDPADLPSVAVAIRPEECVQRIPGDLDGDCQLDAYEICMLGGHGHDVCECVADDGLLSECVEEEQLTSDCENLELLVSDNPLGSNILPVVNQLRGKLSADNEWSINLENKWVDGDRKNVLDASGIAEGKSKTRSKFKSGNTWVGQIHTHPNGTYTVFSWLDLKAISEIYNACNDDFNDEVFLMAVTPNNVTYALRVSDINVLVQKIQDDLNVAEGINDYEKAEYLMLEMAEKYSKSTDLEQSFLELYGSYGISFYKSTNNNLSSWKKLELDENNDQTVNETTCN